MARIRSVHPGLFTDEAFASVSMAARVLFIGIWTECDDNGAFEWKPLGLKMRLLPADNVDAGALLAELEAANMVRQYTHEGRQLGLVRNFARYQRPKKPKAIHFIPAEFRTYVGLDAISSPPVPHQSPTSGEIPPQMEDGGGRREEEEGSEPKGSAAPSAPRDEREVLFRDGLSALMRLTGKPSNSARALIGRWLKVTGDDCLAVSRLIEDAVRDRRSDPIGWIEAHFKPRPAVGAPTGAKVNPDGTFERWAL